MSLVVPVPARYRTMENPSATLSTSVTSISSEVDANRSSVADPPTVPGAMFGCECAWYTLLRELIRSCMRWARTDNLSLLLMKAEQCYPSLNPLLRGNVVAAAFTVREEERVVAAVDTRQLNRNHISFLSDFETWMAETRPPNSPESLQDSDLVSLRELADALEG